MPKNYEKDREYSSKQEEVMDEHDAMRSKTESEKPGNIKDFDEFLKEEGLENNAQNKNN